MGLCKCPKKVVTTLFCYEHRVNVCPKCLVTNHSRCVVQNYLQWLQDSDYTTLCRLCSNPFASQDCVRLICLHLFHWDCLNEYYTALPSTTAPAGYICLLCNTSLFPPPNMASPVADVCREKLSSVNWGRRGLGLPELSDDASAYIDHDTSTNNVQYAFQFQNMGPLGPLQPPQNWLENVEQGRRDSTVVHVDESLHSRGIDSQLPRRQLANSPPDADENKYARRMNHQPTSWLKKLERIMLPTRTRLLRLILFLALFTGLSLIIMSIDSSLGTE